jgi:two-component system response regulator DegU
MSSYLSVQQHAKTPQSAAEMILIAEDNAEVRRMIRNLIEDLDGDIAECSDGGEAIKAYESNHHDVVLMDINMQPIDGLTAAKEILSRHPEAKIIIVSQHQDSQTREVAFKIGITAFVGKDDLTPLRSLLGKQTGNFV